ncbi:flagellar basal-body rod protein FlgG, partial [bacterium]|nr:flagellar basal-body rod protein FlgG [bacterium]
QITNNLANVNTAGYKRSRAEFQDLLYETLQEPGANTSAQTQAPVGIQRGMGVKVAGTARNFEIGRPMSTKRELDMYIQGDGFFVVQLPNGENGYRRDGSFFRGASGRIETIDGYPLQPEIEIPSNAGGVTISEDGTVNVVSSSGKVAVGQLQLATFVNNGGLKAMGKNLFTETEASGQAQLATPGQNYTGGLLQGYLESSNVDMVREMTEMISAQRGFEMNSKVLQAVDSILQNTANIR